MNCERRMVMNLGMSLKYRIESKWVGGWRPVHVRLDGAHNFARLAEWHDSEEGAIKYAKRAEKEDEERCRVKGGRSAFRVADHLGQTHWVGEHK